MLFLVGQGAATVEQELAAHQPDAVGILGISMPEILDALDIDQETDPLATPGGRAGLRRIARAEARFLR